MRVITKRCHGRGRRRSSNCCPNYERMMKTILLQNQQIIIQQQNMMFMVMKQFHPQASQDSHQAASSTSTSAIQDQPAGSGVSTQSQEMMQTAQTFQQATTTVQQLPSQHPEHQQHQQQQRQQHQQHQQQQQQSQQQPDQQSQQHQQHHQHDHQHEHQQQVLHTYHTSQAYLTPVASEQDPISDSKPDDDDISALLGSDDLLTNNLLYNPQTDIGQITPYKSQQPQQETPSYYSSGVELLTTPRVEQQQPRQPATANINQNVVKNLADSFKSPSKPKINVQILSGSATRNMKNNKAKIIQRMNISEFLRHVHQDDQAQQRQAHVASGSVQSIE